MKPRTWLPTITARPPAIIYGAALLALLSILWSAYAITDLMDSGRFGLSVALAGDIGWITVLWAEYRGITIGGKPWAAPAAGWVIALGVGGLLVFHGIQEHSHPQAVAGPFVVLIGKIVWTFAIAAMRDPAALTAEQEAEIHAVIRDSEFAARLHEAERDQIERAADATINRIRAEARTVLARDDVDFEITLERIEKRAQITRRSPFALTAGPIPENMPAFEEVAEQAIAVVGEQPANTPNNPASTPTNTASSVRDQIANSAVTRPNADREQPSMAEVVRDQIASTTNNTDAIRGVMAIIPDANLKSVGAAVRRERRRNNDMKDGYA